MGIVGGVTRLRGMKGQYRYDIGIGGRASVCDPSWAAPRFVLMGDTLKIR